MDADCTEAFMLKNVPRKRGSAVEATKAMPGIMRPLMSTNKADEMLNSAHKGKPAETVVNTKGTVTAKAKR
jgi:hypothetical protein